ncbi:YdiK family protein [Aquibacillus koreensis]|uniref:YdiK family protein n=1 Tax=Aquibacillus koreensis TaxID=279446 RepID=A0A9X3WQF8_9BACI|nr:YdiK family protein [Aquibacillus koreensis]MCT2536700.1 YdiK family protein [Aquibacillus koreensis]MDC3421544.1 YdiK family protein [Aquibacillus koreensis]
MRTSPLFMASLYLGMGVLFTYIAIGTAEETVWNFITILLAFFATLDFVVSFRLFRLHFRIKKAKKKE